MGRNKGSISKPPAATKVGRRAGSRLGAVGTLALLVAVAWVCGALYFQSTPDWASPLEESSQQTSEGYSQSTKKRHTPSPGRTIFERA